jgi:hypothetical protein
LYLSLGFFVFCLPRLISLCLTFFPRFFLFLAE